jgi:hypothetical protein
VLKIQQAVLMPAFTTHRPSSSARLIQLFLESIRSEPSTFHATALSTVLLGCSPGIHGIVRHLRIRCIHANCKFAGAVVLASRYALAVYPALIGFLIYHMYTSGGVCYDLQQNDH